MQRNARTSALLQGPYGRQRGRKSHVLRIIEGYLMVEKQSNGQFKATIEHAVHLIASMHAHYLNADL